MRTQYQVIHETEIRRNQKVIKNENDEVEVRSYPTTKKKKTSEESKLDNDCPIRKQRNWIDFDKGHFRPISNLLLINKNAR